MTLETSQGMFREQIARISEQTGIPAHEAFPRWVCQNILGMDDDAKIDEAVSIGGCNDFGIDVFYAEDAGDATERYVCWIQAKYRDDLDHHITREEAESFASTLGHLRRCPAEANGVFRQKSAEFAKMEDGHPGIKKLMILAVTGKPDSQVRSMLQDQRWMEDRLGCGPGSDVRLEVLDMEGILSRMTIPHTPTLQVRFDDGVIARTDGATGKRSVVGHVGASLLVRLARAHKEALFLESPGQTLGDQAPTHKAMLNTLRDDKARSRFWKLNNGITAVCTKLEEAGSGYGVENFKIVNGRQTLYTLENTTYLIDDVLVLVSIHEAADDEERRQISEATNTQNPVRPADLVTNYREMTEMVLQCKKDFPEFYFERQTRGFWSATTAVQNRVTRRRVMEKTAVARAYCAYALQPGEALVPDRVMFSTADGHYDRIFQDRNVRDLIIPHIFMQLLGELHRKWCGDLRDSPSDKAARDKGIISKDTVKYHVLKFINESMAGLDGSVRRSVEDGLIESFRVLKKGARCLRSSWTWRRRHTTPFCRALMPTGRRRGRRT